MVEVTWAPGAVAADTDMDLPANSPPIGSVVSARVDELTGSHIMVEENLPATPGMRVLIPRRIEESNPERIGPFSIEHISQRDGTKFYLAGGDWALLRFSGTEPVLRLVAEADSLESAAALIDSLKKLIRVESDSGAG